MISSLKTSFFLSATAALLVACGGGGGGDAAPVTVTTYAVDTAYARVGTSGVSVNGTAVDGADTYTIALTVTPAADEVFEGVARKKALQSLTLKKNGAVVTATNIQSYFSINPYASQGARHSDGTYSVSNNSGSFSSAAKVGDGGALGISTAYTDSTKSSVVNTVESTWTLEPDTAITAFACSNSVIKNSAGAQTGTASGCFKIDAAGNVLGLRFIVSVSGKSLVFK